MRFISNLIYKLGQKALQVFCRSRRARGRGNHELLLPVARESSVRQISGGPAGEGEAGGTAVASLKRSWLFSPVILFLTMASFAKVYIFFQYLLDFTVQHFSGLSDDAAFDVKTVWENGFFWLFPVELISALILYYKFGEQINHTSQHCEELMEVYQAPFIISKFYNPDTMGVGKASVMMVLSLVHTIGARLSGGLGRFHTRPAKVPLHKAWLYYTAHPINMFAFVLNALQFYFARLTNVGVLTGIAAIFALFTVLRGWFEGNLKHVPGLTNNTFEEQQVRFSKAMSVVDNVFLSASQAPYVLMFLMFAFGAQDVDAYSSPDAWILFLPTLFTAGSVAWDVLSHYDGSLGQSQDDWLVGFFGFNQGRRDVSSFSKEMYQSPEDDTLELRQEETRNALLGN